MLMNKENKAIWTRLQDDLGFHAASKRGEGQGEYRLDKGTTRVIWHDEGDGEGWWRVLQFDSKNRLVEFNIEMSMATPAATVIAIINTVERKNNI